MALDADRAHLSTMTTGGFLVNYFTDCSLADDVRGGVSSNDEGRADSAEIVKVKVTHF